VTAPAVNDPVEVSAQPGLDLALPVAKIRGEPLTELPTDLYIPPEALSVFLNAFEGPMDLLLYLIRKHSLDILDIPMAELTRQYMEYVEMMRTQQLELAAEYLLMAALLIEIKSRMLLPRPKRDDAAEAEDPRAELVRRLLEYEQIKLAARNLDDAPLLGRDFMPVTVWLEKLVAQRQPAVNPDDLMAAWHDILRHAKMHTHHRIGRQELSVREHMSRILLHLKGSGHALFEDLFSREAGKPELLVTFLALLELVRERLIDLVQNEPFAPIHARLV